jgi:hypothetical protein
VSISEETMPARWSRSLDIEIQESGRRILSYRDTFILGDVRKGKEKRRAEIIFKVVGSVDSPERVVIEIGCGPEEKARVLFKDEERNLKVLVHPPFGKEQLQFLVQNPEYAFLREEKEITVGEVMALIRDKIDLLSNHWYEPESVLNKIPQISSPPRILPEI